jgi:hypothetical protein
MNSISSNSGDDSLLEIRTDANQEQDSVVYGEPSQEDANLYSFGTEDNTGNNAKQHARWLMSYPMSK